MILTLEQLKERLAYWQRILRLQDWDIDLQIVRRATLGSASSVGQCEGSIYRRAVVKIADPIDFRPDEAPRLVDMEDTLVHELLHLHMKDLRVPRAREGERELPEEVAEERAIEALSGALVALERRQTTTLVVESPRSGEDIKKLASEVSGALVAEIRKTPRFSCG